MNNEEFSRRAIRHGEVLLVPVDSVPKGYTESFRGNEYIVAHSESGHHHVAVGDLTVFTPKGGDGNAYLRMNENGLLEHRKTFDFHESKSLFEGFYEVRLKNEYDPFADVIRQVVD